MLMAMSLLASTPVKAEHDSQIDEATRHRDVGDVHRPHLVRPRDLHPAQQIRVDLVAGLGLRRARTAIEDLYPHPPHQRFDMPTADAQHVRLLCDRQIVLTVDHRFALSNPALLSAPSKKSFSSVSSPILA